MMLFVMPFMLAFFTINLVAAVGIFWTTGQFFQIIQDVILLKKSGTPIRLPFAKPLPEVVDVIPVKKKRS
jgi:membrane protein insertase Oxa1/YidC/SpoIIIJ